MLKIEIFAHSKENMSLTTFEIHFSIILIFLRISNRPEWTSKYLLQEQQKQVKVLISSLWYDARCHSFIITSTELSLEPLSNSKSMFWPQNQCTFPSGRHFSVFETFMILFWYFFIYVHLNPSSLRIIKDIYFKTSHTKKAPKFPYRSVNMADFDYNVTNDPPPPPPPHDV